MTPSPTPTPRRRRRSSREARAIAEFTVMLLVSGLGKSAIKRQLKQRFACSGWMAEKYLARAREAVLVQTNLDELSRLVEAAVHHLATARNPRAGPHDRYAALEALHRLFGKPEPDGWHAAEVL